VNRSITATSSRARRRRLLRKGLMAAAVVVVLGAVVVVGVLAWLFRGAETSTVGDLDFDNPLRIPPVLEPEVAADGSKDFDLRFTAGTTEIVDGLETPTWGLNGTHLGPTIRADLGDRVNMTVTNGVDEPTTLHWHGMHLPGAMDGGPHQQIDPGATWTPSWTIDQPAATLWYHPHLHGRTADHVYRGAAGMFILDDPDGPEDLPDRYGVDDIPVIVQDKAFNGDGTLADREPPFSFTGTLGDQTLINGTHDPHLDVTTERVRLRLLNASVARSFNMVFDDERSFEVIATDSGLLEAPVPVNQVQLSPGERAEIVVRVASGERTVLRSDSPDLGMNFFTERMNGGDDSFDLLELRAADDLEPSPAVPQRLEHVPPLTAMDADRTRQFDLTDLAINGKEMDHARIDVAVPDGATEIWELHNRSGTPHSFHPHLIHFQILDIDGSAPPPVLAGWTDTVYVAPGSTVRIIGRFEGEPDDDNPFMFHCHILQHEDAGMMGQFVLTDEPATSAVADRSA
jgi:FtsP/CotA-like multicopper oxidase with cupredoxin domain